jgi:hypothetical protein
VSLSASLQTPICQPVVLLAQRSLVRRKSNNDENKNRGSNGDCETLITFTGELNLQKNMFQIEPRTANPSSIEARPSAFDFTVIPYSESSTDDIQTANGIK